MTEYELRNHLDQFHSEWSDRLGSTGDHLAQYLRKLVDLLLVEQEEIVTEATKRLVAPWALADSDERIPLDKISKEGLLMLLANPSYISNGELLEMLKARFPDFG